MVSLTLIKKCNKIIKTHYKNSLKEYILQADVEYPRNLNDLHNDLPF